MNVPRRSGTKHRSTGTRQTEKVERETGFEPATLSLEG